MPLRPNYQDVDMDNFFEQLTSIKDANLENLRNSVVDAPNQAVMPREANPNEMENAREEIMHNKQIASEREDAWAKWREKRAMNQSIPILIGAYIAYKFFL